MRLPRLLLSLREKRENRFFSPSHAYTRPPPAPHRACFASGQASGSAVLRKSTIFCSFLRDQLLLLPLLSCLVQCSAMQYNGRPLSFVVCYSRSHRCCRRVGRAAVEGGSPIDLSTLCPFGRELLCGPRFHSPGAGVCASLLFSFAVFTPPPPALPYQPCCGSRFCGRGSTLLLRHLHGELRRKAVY